MPNITNSRKLPSLHWMTPKEITQRYSMCQRAVSTILRNIERSNRYPEGSVIRTPRSTYVLDTVVHDYMRNRVALEHNLHVAEYSGEQMRLELQRLAI